MTCFESGILLCPASTLLHHTCFPNIPKNLPRRTHASDWLDRALLLQVLRHCIHDTAASRSLALIILRYTRVLIIQKRSKSNECGRVGEDAEKNQRQPYFSQSRAVRLFFSYYTHVSAKYQKRPDARRMTSGSAGLSKKALEMTRMVHASSFLSYRTLVFADYQKNNWLDICAAFWHQQNSTIHYPMLPVPRSRDFWPIFPHHTNIVCPTIQNEKMEMLNKCLCLRRALKESVHACEVFVSPTLTTFYLSPRKLFQKLIIICPCVRGLRSDVLRQLLMLLRHGVRAITFIL